MLISQTLTYYKRDDVREAIVEHARSREVAIRYDQRGFGKRPDALLYPQDVLDLAQRRATSFHCSEERWSNPLAIRTGMGREELDRLRTGWDLVLDVDAPRWELARIASHLLIIALRRHGVRAITAKFSGNKGFHIGVPFEAFPEAVDQRRTSSLFPEAPRRITAYLIDYIGAQLLRVEGDTVLFEGGTRVPITTLEQWAGQPLLRDATKAREQWDYLCRSCGRSKRLAKRSDRIICPECNLVMDRFDAPADEGEAGLDINAMLSVDTLLVASRHLFRMPYSMHEKSGLVSVPIDPDAVLTFEREAASPEKVTCERRFLERGASPGEAATLLQTALDFTARHEEADVVQHLEIPEEAIPEEAFPPCMRAILRGLRDGKKRALFALTNFLTGCGWSAEQVDERVRAWNASNPEPLREVNVKSHLRYHHQRETKAPPPSCRRFYEDFGVCKPDQLCAKIRNPLSYAKRKGAVVKGRKKDQ